MQNKTIIICLIISQLLVSVFSSAGGQANCTGVAAGTDCASVCGVPTVAGTGTTACSWVSSSTLTTCTVTDCTCLTTGTVTGITNLNDQFCTSCKGSTSNTYANGAGTACVAASASCNSTIRGTTAWTVGDCTVCTPTTPALVGSTCKACNTISSAWTDANCAACASTSTPKGNTNFANSAGTACVNASATCASGSRGTTAANAWTVADCLACTPATPVFVPAASPAVTTSCVACSAATSGLNDALCNACASSASPAAKTTFANTAGSACVASSATCTAGSRGTTAANAWTAADCLACTPATPAVQFGASPATTSSCVACNTINSGWTDANCNSCAMLLALKQKISSLRLMEVLVQQLCFHALNLLEVQINGLMQTVPPAMVLLLMQINMPLLMVLHVKLHRLLVLSVVRSLLAFYQFYLLCQFDYSSFKQKFRIQNCTF
uniref:Surface antigen n=1 Tax=Tetrahymena thermophila TaxID=5911 RepID=Q94827_TETTH|nr:surface antigen [Tetrahymena thermophila]